MFNMCAEVSSTKPYVVFLKSQSSISLINVNIYFSWSTTKCTSPVKGIFQRNVESLTKQCPKCGVGSCQQHSRDVMAVYSPPTRLTSRLVSLTAMWDEPHAGHMLRGVDVLSSSLFGCLLVGAEAAASSPKRHIKHSYREEEDGKETKHE